MCTPSEEARKYYVYGFWHIYDTKPYVTKDNKVDIREFDDIEKATEYLKEQTLSNVNITWCLLWDKNRVESIKQSEKIK